MNVQLQTFAINGKDVTLYVPLQKEVHSNYSLQKQNNADTPFPFWAKVWPASVAMAQFIAQQFQYVQHKKVLELAAGLGLPSMVAAQFASEVVCSDYLQDAVDIIQQTIAHNHLTNTKSALLNWHQLPEEIKTDVLLLSDINYDPVEFNILYKVVTRFLAQGATVILSTPQRLMAKPFIDLLFPFCTHQQEVEVSMKNEKVMTSIFVLKNNF